MINTYEEKIDSLKSIINSNYEYFTMYNNYLPRVNILHLLNIHPQLEDYYQLSKQGLNKLSKFNLNPLISEDQNLDWFIYDDESMNFLISVGQKSFNILSSIRFDDNKVYLEDQYPTVVLKDSDLTNFFINIIYIFSFKPFEFMNKKLRINTTTTALDMLKLMNKKLKSMKPFLAFDPQSKVLKAKSIEDYIFDLKAPLVKFAYINSCVKKNIEAEYYIRDNPFFNRENLLDNNKKSLDELIGANEESNIMQVEHNVSLANIENYNVKENIFNIASFAPSNEGNANQVFQAQHNQTDSLSEFIKSMLDDINANTNSKIEECSKVLEDISFNIEEEKSSFDLGTTFNRSLTNHSIEYSFFRTKTNNQLIKQMALSQVRSSKASILSRKFTKKKKQKNDLLKEQANIYLENANTPVDITSMLNINYEVILINKVLRPFSIVFRNAELNTLFNALIDNSQFYSVLFFKFQICGGLQKYSRPLTIAWETKDGDYNPCFNKRLYFDMNYQSLPPFASILIRMKTAHYDKYQEARTKETVGWANFKLFDYNKRLKTGVHKISLNQNKFSDDSYFCYFESTDSKASSVCFELESFSAPIENEPVKLDNFKYNLSSLMISETDEKRIEEIKSKTPFDELNNYDKEVLWVNRYFLSQEPSIFAKVLLCIDYKNPNHMLELEKLLSLAKPLNPIQSLELLTGKYLHVSIRQFAVRSLMNSSPEDMEKFLIQLIQGLKYEMYHDSELATFLLTMAINYPLTIGHSLFWSLRSEMYNPNVQQRFALYLEVFLSKIGKKIAQIYVVETMFVRELHIISDIPKDTRISKDERKHIFIAALERLNNKIEKEGFDVSIPLDFKLRLNRIKVDLCRPMKSKKKPLWLVFQNRDSIGEDITVLFKAGDDLRMDIVTLQIFKMMQALWFENKLGLKMSLYNVVCTGYCQGMVEIVKNSETIAQIHVNEGGAMQSFDETSLVTWLKNNCIGSQEEAAENFMLTNVAYCVATFVLGIGDRHSDNIMLKPTGELFHIDFGHFLGHFKYKMGIKRERAPFVFTKQFQSVLGGEKGRVYKEFKEKFSSAYQILRDNSEMIITLLRILLCIGIPELTENSIKYLDTSLCLNQTSVQARNYLETMLQDSLNSLSIQFNFWIHVIANS